MRLTARGRAGHGSMVHDDNAVTAVAEAVARLGRHQFPLVLTDSVEQFLAAVGEETGYSFDPDSPDLDGTIAKLGGIARIVGATLRDTANPTMLKAGYKANVIPADRRSGHRLPGAARAQGGLRARGRRAHRPRRHPRLERDLPSYETTFDGDLVDAMNDALLAVDPDARTVPYMLSGGTDAKAFARLGYSLLRLHPAAAAAGPGLRGAVPRRR